ncbi:MAG: CinA family protein [Clostridia bacterium]|nr:CinA family protein [Clostridia bacterium]
MTSSEALVSLLRNKKLKIACAEPCTGGLLAKKITDISGSSEIFELGVVAYANRIKTKILGVPAKLLEEKGAVCAEVAAFMAKGVCALSESDIGTGITGIAGPGGGTPEKPVGLVYVAVYMKSTDKVYVGELHLNGDRSEIRNATAEKVISKVIELVRNT